MRKLLALFLLIPSLCFGAETGSIYGTNTRLLLHMDGTDASTTFTDSELGTAKTVTANGDAQIDTAQSVFGGASFLSDGIGDYLSISDNDDWAFGTGDFTIDFRIKFADLSTTQTFVSQYAASACSWLINWNTSNKLQLVYSLDGTNANVVFKNVSWTPSTDTWYHVAVVRSGNNLYFFVDGAQVGTTQDVTGTNILNVGQELWVSGRPDIGIQWINGWIDELRLIKGTAVWTSNFTPPTAPYHKRRVIIST